MIYGEPGAGAAFAAFAGGLLLSVNASEVMTKVARDGPPPDATRDRLHRFGLTLVPASEEHARRAATLARHVGPSTGDRFCLAPAQERSLPVVTADRFWAELPLGVQIELIR